MAAAKARVYDRKGSPSLYRIRLRIGEVWSPVRETKQSVV